MEKQSKVLEKHIHSLMVLHLEEHCPLCDSQWGFRQGCSTVTALISNDNKWLESLESGKEICPVFLDYKKAFDCVPHCPLLSELKRCGLHDGLLLWLMNYLSQRKQQVVVDGAMSAKTLVVSRVPQGSVLGPLLFLIYIDEVTKLELSPQTELVLYADDFLIYKPITELDDLLPCSPI